jgi:AcrR family transcriptional regulator
VNATGEVREPLNRTRVLRAAVSLADDAGIESLSMRKLGHILGVEAMSLYRHVANKDDILDGMVGLVMTEIELPAATEPWGQAVRRSAISAHEALLHHPWACSLMMMVPIGRAARAARTRYMDALLASLRRAGFTPDLTYRAYHVLDSHVLGFTLWQIGHQFASEGDVSVAANFVEELPSDQYPDLALHIEQHGQPGHDDEFEFGLDLVIDGLTRMMEGQ